MRIASSIVLLLIFCGVIEPSTAQTPRKGFGLEFGGSYNYRGKGEDPKDNILDLDRDGGIEFTVLLNWHDTLTLGKHPLPFSWGLGCGVLDLDEELLMPIQAQLVVLPVRHDPVPGAIDLTRLGCTVAFGYCIGAWKETTTGQLNGGSFSSLGIRYDLSGGRQKGVALEAGFNARTMKGPYRRIEDGGWVDEESAQFLYGYFSIRLIL